MAKIIKENIIKLLNERIYREEMSSRIYKAMAVWLEFNGFVGAAKLWNTYSQEELKHAEWAYSYLLDLDIMPEVPELNQPDQIIFKGLPQIINLSYKHEIEITNQCQTLAKAAFEASDFMTLELAHRYLKEQVEELAKTNNWLNQLNSFGDSKESLRLLDSIMGA